MDNGDDFEDAVDRVDVDAGARFVVDIDGFEGPIDLLLTLARDQKVDLTQISILQLAEQYLTFVVHARRANLELAADYLVMAAWLAYLKSRLLLPNLQRGDEPSGEEMAAALAFQLKRLGAMQESGARLMARPRLGQDFFSRGMTEDLAPVVSTVFEVTLYDLLRAYADHRRQVAGRTLRIDPIDLHSVDNAVQRLRRLLGVSIEWENLWRFLPDDVGDGTFGRSAFASTFAASLELARKGELQLRQNSVFGPIYLRSTGITDAEGS